MSSKKLGLALGSVIVSAGLVVWLLTRLDAQQALQLLSEAHTGWLVVAALITAGMPFTSVMRWRGVLRATEGAQLPFFVSLRAVLMANVLNSFLPSKLGDAAKAGYLREKGGLTQGVGTVLLERLVDLGVLGALALLGSLQSGLIWGWLAGVALLGGVVTLFSIMLFIPFARLPLPDKVTSLFSKLKSVFTSWRADARAVAQTLTGSLLTWSLGGLTVYCLVRAFGAEVGLGTVYSIFPPAILAGLAPLTVSGIGTRDAAFVTLLAPYTSTEQATLIGLSYTLYAYWLLSLLSLPVVFWELKAQWTAKPLPNKP